MGLIVMCSETEPLKLTFNHSTGKIQADFHAEAKDESGRFVIGRRQQLAAE